MASKGESSADFSSKVSQIVTDGFLSVALAVGNRAGLWDLLSGFDEPKTCSEIAQAAGLQER